MDEQMNQQAQTNTDQERANTDAQSNPASNAAPEQSAPQAANPAPEAPKAESSDVEKNKMLAIIGYILPILFFVPLINEASKDSQFARFHSNQQLILLIAWIVVDIVGTVIPLIGWFLLLPIGSIFLVIVAIMGIVNAAKGEMKEMPLIGGFKIL